ncbi:endochitinase A-like isoform X2 [Varroa jacobsoni]|uniref:endochitinase A-like isoform X2 n=1 Tax=Varroa jacobsoni TaxID=62625 RepID=UPI000BF8B586|nr:endochitinase A-like isoform X2 [Varroa jacobsoni]
MIIKSDCLYHQALLFTSTTRNVLESKKAPAVKKKIVMRNALGDYRKKMAAEEDGLTKKILDGTHMIAQFDATAQPSLSARALHIHKSSTTPPSEIPSARNSSVVTSPATSSKSSTPSPIKQYSTSSPVRSDASSTESPPKSSTGHPLKPSLESPSKPFSETLSKASAKSPLKPNLGSTPKSHSKLSSNPLLLALSKLNTGLEPQRETCFPNTSDELHAEKPFAFNFEIPPEDLNTP